jgi:signal peptidase II
LSRGEDRLRRLAAKRAAAVGIAVLILDQLTKRLVVHSLPRGQRESFLPFIDIVHVRNDGVAFSSFAGKPWIVGLLVLGALAALTVWFVRNRAVPLAWLAAGMLAGGALGNVLDRVVEGAVVDFIKPPHWPAFNLADTSIVLGMALLVLVVELEHRRTQDDTGTDARAQRG